jgi:hypothetical protein
MTNIVINNVAGGATRMEPVALISSLAKSLHKVCEKQGIAIRWATAQTVIPGLCTRSTVPSAGRAWVKLPRV